jgi:hypothetical protein
MAYTVLLPSVLHRCWLRYLLVQWHHAHCTREGPSQPSRNCREATETLHVRMHGLLAALRFLHGLTAPTWPLGSHFLSLCCSGRYSSWSISIAIAFQVRHQGENFAPVRGNGRFHWWPSAPATLSLDVNVLRCFAADTVDRQRAGPEHAYVYLQPYTKSKWLSWQRCYCSTSWQYSMWTWFSIVWSISHVVYDACICMEIL